MIADVLLFIGGLCLLLLIGAVDGRREEDKLAIGRLSERIAELEQQKQAPAEPVMPAAAAKPKSRKVTLRTWNEDIAAAEDNK